MSYSTTRSGVTRLQANLSKIYPTREKAAEEPFQEPTGAFALVSS